MQNETILTNVFSDSLEVFSDMVHYAKLSSGIKSLPESIAARVNDVIAASGVNRTDALRDLKKQAIEAGLDPRRASDVFIELGFRERAEKAESESKKELAEKLAPVIEKLIALAKAEAGDDAGRALRRAYLTLNSEKAA